jgi:hypothetical protein
MYQRPVLWLSRYGRCSVKRTARGEVGDLINSP